MNVPVYVVVALGATDIDPASTGDAFMLPGLIVPAVALFEVHESVEFCPRKIVVGFAESAHDVTAVTVIVADDVTWYPAEFVTRYV